MSVNSTSWKKGQSGNPKGRPVIRTRVMGSGLRALALEMESDEERRMSMLRRLWNAMENATVEMKSGEKRELSNREWIDLCKWLFQHMDGKLRDKTHDEEWRDVEAEMAAVEAEERAAERALYAEHGLELYEESDWEDWWSAAKQSASITHDLLDYGKELRKFKFMVEHKIPKPPSAVVMEEVARGRGRREVPEVPEVPPTVEEEEMPLFFDEACSSEELARTAESDREAADRDSYERYGDLLLNPETMMPYCPSEQWLREHPAEVEAAQAKAKEQQQMREVKAVSVAAVSEIEVESELAETGEEPTVREIVISAGVGSRMADFLALARNGVMPSTTGRFRFTEVVEAIPGAEAPG